MENETNRNELNVLETSENNYNNIFKIDYPNQNLDNNKEYQQWYQSMIKIHGNNAYIIKCNLDNLYFCINNKECLKEPCFKGKCPICGKYICIFCLNHKNRYPWHHCCLKRGIKKSYNQGCLYAKKYSDKTLCELCENLIYFIPGVNLFFFMIRIFEIFYIYLGTKESLNNEDKEFISYKEKLDEKIPEIIFVIIFCAFSFFLCIPFFIYNLLFLVIIFLISIPFNFLPIKFIYGSCFSLQYINESKPYNFFI